MRILFVCQYFYPEQFRINDICFTLAKQGHDITVLTGLPNYPQGKVLNDYRWFKKRHEEINGVKIIRVPLIGRGKTKIRLVFNYLSFAFFASLKALFIKGKYDVVFAYQLSPVTMVLPAILYKKRTGCKMLLYCNDLWPESVKAVGISQNSLIYKTIYWLSKWIYARADVMAISSRLFAKYFDEVHKLKGTKEYLPIYAEGIFEKIEISKRSKESKESEEINLLFAGNIGKMQSVETVIRAAEKLKNNPNILFHIVGDGSALENCRTLANKLGVNSTVKFYGHRVLSEMPNFYSLADAFLVTLSANQIISYTLPNKVQSYLAVGKPILGAIDGETSNVIQEAGCGLCCCAEDDEGLAQIITQFANEKEKHTLYGRKAREYYDKYFTKEVFLSKALQLLKELSM